MGIDTDGEWDGICACGKVEADGVRCRFGGTHETLAVSQARFRAANPHVAMPAENDDLGVFG